MNRKKIIEIEQTLEAFETLEKLGVTTVRFKSGSSISIRDAIKIYKDKLKSTEMKNLCHCMKGC